MGVLQCEDDCRIRIQLTMIQNVMSDLVLVLLLNVTMWILVLL